MTQERTARKKGTETFQPQLDAFKRQMEHKLLLHVYDRGESWKEPGWNIVARLREEIREALEDGASPMEWADVANFAFFAWYRAVIDTTGEEPR